MDYGYSYEYASSDELGVAGMIGLMLVVYLLAIALSIVMYVFQSLGTYTIAKRRGIKNPWLAWLPVGTEWTWGCIADQYSYVAKGQVKNRRKVLLALSIVTVVLAFVFVGMYIGMFVDIIMNMEAMEYMSDEAAMELILTPMLSMMGVGFIMSIISIVQTVFIYISLYHVYASCDPSNSVMFIVLSIVFNVTQPFFLFACRNKDLGMPPRRQEQASSAYQTVAQDPYVYQPVAQEPSAYQPVVHDPWQQPEAPAQSQQAWEQPVSDESQDPWNQPDSQQ